MQLIFVLLFLIPSWGRTEPPPRHYVPVVIENGVFSIEGKIDSHIYDSLMFPNDKMDSVTTVRLNSLGGNHFWAMAIAEKIRERGWKTQLLEGDYCASACVYLFGAGVERQAHPSTWFGIHGARLGAGYMVRFSQECIDNGQLKDNTGCAQLKNDNFELNLRETRTAFAMMEASGVSPELWDTYMNLSDDPNWLEHFNFLRKPDMVVPAQEALGFSLVTALIGR
jgi:hypothetical protein